VVVRERRDRRSRSGSRATRSRRCAGSRYPEGVDLTGLVGDDPDGDFPCSTVRLDFGFTFDDE
jgi:hypothetical protein